MLTKTVDLATEINQLIGFEELVNGGELPDELVAGFHRSVRVQDKIEQQGIEVQSDLIVQAIPASTALYRQYMNAISELVKNRV